MAKTITFLTLPREIRDEIYSYLLVTDKSICPFTRAIPRVLNLHPKILQTCKTIFEEASSVLIQKNRFLFMREFPMNGKTQLPSRWNNPDPSWQIMLNHYHCTSLPINSRLAPPSHRMRHLELRFGSESLFALVLNCFNIFLTESQVLKSLRLAIYSPWSIHKLAMMFAHPGFTPIAQGSCAVTLLALGSNSPRAIQHISTSENLNIVLGAWNRSRDRKWKFTGSKSLLEDHSRDWWQEGLELRRWNLMP